MSETQTFNFEFDNSKIRTFLIEHEFWLSATDICKIFEISNTSTAVRKLHESDYRKVKNSIGAQMYIVDECGAYSLALFSKKEREYKIDFHHWLSHSVFSNVQKPTGYKNDDMSVLADLLQQAANQLKAKFGIHQSSQQKNSKIETCSQPVTIDEFIGLLSRNGINITKSMLLDYLFRYKYLSKNSNFPKENSIKNGLFKIEERVISSKYGNRLVSKTVKVTTKGQEELISKLRKPFS